MTRVSGVQLRYSWVFVVLLSMAPLWLFSLFGRGYWTPDEPREAALAWSMSQSATTHQGDWVLPQLGTRTFQEKPPLSYWMSAASFKMFGQSAAAARVPNLLYILVGTISVMLLAQAMAGTSAGMLGGLLFASMFESLRVSIWLAPDACLLAGCAVALLGAYRGYIAQDAEQKWRWYTLMHVGALWGFMAKSAVGWLVPGLALLTLIVWERRWRELVRPQLWAGLALQVIVIGLWVSAVLDRPNGMDDLKVLFWNNLAGRFTHVNATAELDYAAAHQNWFGKYLLELPYYLFPWFLLLIGGLRGAWTATRDGIARTPLMTTTWRFAIASWVPFTLLISLSATARDVYFAPALIGISVMMSMWVHELDSKANSFDRWMLRGTRYLVMFLLVLVAVVLIVLGLTELQTSKQLAWISLAITALVVISFTACRRAAAAQQQNQHAISMVWCYLTTVIALTIVMLAATPVVNQWQDLGQIARQVKRDAGTQPLAMLRPDETTIAMLSYHADIHITELKSLNETPAQQLQNWFKEHPRSHVLVLLPGRAPGAITHWLERFKPQRLPGDGIAGELMEQGAATVVAKYELPMGRRYALLVAPLSASNSQTLKEHT
ncbi:MAG TPA: glycosyltransferase family 39 protein [Steroidobacteraceae bacterium]|nr:glycosyltransferase family 39 protein [Steroidobacteraceae bacterium]